MEATDTQVVTGAGELFSGAGIQLFTLALAAFYCAVVYAFRVSLGGSRAAGERYVRLALALAALTIGLAAVKTSAATLATGGQALAGAAAGVVAIAIVVVQVLAIRAAGAVTLQKELAAAVVQAKRRAIAMGALTGAPIVLLFTGMHPVRDEVMAYLLAAEAVTIGGWFLVHTLGLFVRQKVSVLVWILYLCSVEVVPVWAVVALAVRLV